MSRALLVSSWVSGGLLQRFYRDKTKAEVVIEDTDVRRRPENKLQNLHTCKHYTVLSHFYLPCLCISGLSRACRQSPNAVCGEIRSKTHTHARDTLCLKLMTQIALQLCLGAALKCKQGGTGGKEGCRMKERRGRNRGVLVASISGMQTFI